MKQPQRILVAKQDVFLNERGEAVVHGKDARAVLVRSGQQIEEKRFVNVPNAEALITSEATKSAPKGDAGKDLEERDEKTRGKKK